MTRPRLAAIISAIAASTVAFLVVHRWSLAGTLTGAAVVPIIWTLVSHWSNESLDRLDRLARKHARLRAIINSPSPYEAAAVDEAGPSAQEEPTSPHTRTVYVTRGPAPLRTRPRLQWSLAAATILAFAFSIYSFTAGGTVEKVVVEKQVEVIEKTVFVSSGSSDSGGSSGGTESSTLSTTTTTAPPEGQDQTPTTTPSEPTTTAPAPAEPVVTTSVP
jgi:hypothetical protein